MKKLTILSILLLGVCFSIRTQAQVSLSVNLGVQPDWGPSGYNHVDYYYIPDMDAYYDVNSRIYIYQDGGRWVRRSYVPARYRNVDLYRVHKVVINERDPWRRHTTYRTQYRSYSGKYDQQPIRAHHDNGNHNGNRGYNNGNHGNRGYNNDNRGNRGYNGGNRGNNGNHDNGHNDRGGHGNGGDHGHGNGRGK